MNGKTTPGVQQSANPDPLERFAGYVAARFADDPRGSRGSLRTAGAMVSGVKQPKS